MKKSQEFPERGPQLWASGVLDKCCRYKFKDLSVRSTDLFRKAMNAHSRENMGIWGVKDASGGLRLFFKRNFVRDGHVKMISV